MQCCLTGVGITSYTPVPIPSLLTLKCPMTHGITYRYLCVTTGKNARVWNLYILYF